MQLLQGIEQREISSRRYIGGGIFFAIKSFRLLLFVNFVISLWHNVLYKKVDYGIF